MPDGPIKTARGNRHVRSLLIGYSGLLIGHSIARFYYTGRHGGAVELDEPVTMAASLTRVIISSTEIARRIIMLIKWRFFCLFVSFLSTEGVGWEAGIRHKLFSCSSSHDLKPKFTTQSPLFNTQADQLKPVLN